MSLGKLYGKHTNLRFAKVLITAAYSDVTIDTPKEFRMGVSNKEPEYLEKFPLGQAPGFETPDGKVLTESSAIAQFVAEQKENNPLLGKDPWERAEIQKYVLLSEAQLMSHSLDIIFMMWGITPKIPEVAERAYVKLHDLWGELDRQIQAKDYLVGGRLTLADIDIGCALCASYRFLLYPDIIGKYPNLHRYFKAIVFTPHFQKYLETPASEDDYAKAAPSFS